MAGGLNTYAYVGGNPVGLVDPLGLNAATAEAGAIGGTMVCGPVCGVIGGVAGFGLGAWGTYEFWNWYNNESTSVVRPKNMSPIEERQFDRHCANSDDPCSSIKAAVQQAIAMARQKINNLLLDKGGLFGTTGWTTHINDLKGRLAAIGAMISVGQMMGCDMSQEAADAARLVIPGGPN